MQVNLQIVPYLLTSKPDAAKLVQLKSREKEGGYVTALRWDLKPSDAEAVKKLFADLAAAGYVHQVDGVDGHEVYNRRFSIRCAETGGGYTNTGHATIIAGMRGEKLPAVGGQRLCGGEHAVFYVYRALMVHYSHHRGNGKGHVSLVEVANDLCSVKETELWRFSDEEPDALEIVNQAPDGVTFPAEAVEAAKQKSRSYHCRSAYYCAERGADAPSGPRRDPGGGPYKAALGY